jgi:hypothetical protein
MSTQGVLRPIRRPSTITWLGTDRAGTEMPRSRKDTRCHKNRHKLSQEPRIDTGCHIERRKRLVRAVPSRATDRGGVMNAPHSCCGMRVLLAPGAGCAAASCALRLAEQISVGASHCVYGRSIGHLWKTDPKFSGSGGCGGNSYINKQPH